ncbi:ATP-binding protein [Parabacteroides sp. APC149_11_2_Y6]
MRKSGYIFILLIHLFCCCQALFAQQHTPKDYILVFHSINFNETWTHETFETIRTTFTSEGYLVRGEELQIPAIKDTTEILDKLAYLREEYAVPPKMVVCIGDPAWLLIRPLFDDEWKDVPILICYSRGMVPRNTKDMVERKLDPDKTMVPTSTIVDGYDVCTLRQPLYIRETIETMQKLQPGLNKVAFIADNRYISILTRQELQSVLEQEFPKIQLDVLSWPELSTENLLDTLTTYSNKNTGIIYYSWYATPQKDENHYLVDNVQKMTNSFSNPPVYLVVDLGLENGNFAGGHYISVDDFNETVVATMKKKLQGGPCVCSDLIAGTPKTYLNYQHLYTHGIAPSNYPGSAVYFDEPPTFIEKYKMPIIGGVVIFFLLLSIIFLRMRLLILKQRENEKEYLAAKRTEELNRKYRLILKASRTTAWVWDVHKRQIHCDQESFASETMYKNGRYTVEEDDFFRMIHPDDNSKVRRAYHQLIMEKTDIMHEEFRFFRPDTGLYDWLECYAIVGERGPEDAVSMLVGSSVVISDRKKMEEELREKEKIEEANRLKSAFLANMSHEIRTPLNAIVGFSNLIAQEDSPAEERDEFRKIIETNNELLLQLINDILDLSKIEAGKLDFTFSYVDVTEMLNRLFQVFSDKVKPNVALKCNVPADPCFIHSERNRLIQVITNFLTNACKFTNEGSITMGYEEIEGGLRFYVTDTGKGIAEENVPHVFERFAKFDAFIQGSGLGLSICQMIIECLKGEIGVESKEGEGSTFWFTIPCEVFGSLPETKDTSSPAE